METSQSYTFPDGSWAWIAQERLEPINWRRDWSRTGVKPDVEAYADWETFTFSNGPGNLSGCEVVRSRVANSSRTVRPRLSLSGHRAT